jgi:hypothetical protein
MTHLLSPQLRPPDHFGLVTRLTLVLVTLCYLSGVAHAQTNRWDIGNPGSAGVVTVSGSGLPFLVAEPGVTLAWCQYPANAVPCTNYATTYTSASLSVSCPTNAQVVLQGSNTCQATDDNFGNLGVYAPSGMYSYTLTVNGVSTGPYLGQIGVSGPGAPSGSLQANDAGFFAGVPNSSVNFVSGNISSSAGLSFGTVNATTTSSAAQFLSNASNPATAGAVALANSDSIFWRNFANNANEGLGVNSSDVGTASFAGGFALTGATAKLWFGGFTSSFPMLKPVSTGLQLRLGDDSAFAGPFDALSYKVGGSQTLSGVQGSTGANFFACTGLFTSGDGVTTDANGNCVDAGTGTGPITAPSSGLRIEFGTGTGSGTITFSPAFSGTPIVLFTTGGIGTTNYSGSISSTSVTVNSSDGAPYTWFAIGPK